MPGLRIPLLFFEESTEYQKDSSLNLIPSDPPHGWMIPSRPLIKLLPFKVLPLIVLYQNLTIINRKASQILPNSLLDFRQKLITNKQIHSLGYKNNHLK